MPILHTNGLAAALVAAGLGLAASCAGAQLVYTSGHGDLGVGYTPGATQFDVHWHVDSGAVVDGRPLSSGAKYEPDELVAFTNSPAPAPSNADAWLGVAGGAEVWRLGSDTFPPNLGFNSSETGSDSAWLDSALLITLSGWNSANPGEAALRSGASAGAVTWFSTFSPLDTENGDNTWEFDMGVGHVHLAWYFSEPGYYELTFDWAGTYIGGKTPVDVTGTGTFGFQAGVVPEPGIGWLLGLGLVVVGGLRLRKAIRKGAVLAAGLACALIPGALAQSVYTGGHGDLGVGYTPGDPAFDTHWHLDAGAVVDGAALPLGGAGYAPGDLAAHTDARANTPSSSPAWLGVPGSTSVYRLGSDPFPPNLGFNASEAGPDSHWLDSTLVITLSGWNPANPGEVALRDGAGSGARTFFSTYAPDATFNGDNTWEFDMGAGHAHLVWYFSDPGPYELEFTWQGTYIGAPGSPYRTSPIEVTGAGIFDFSVGAVPEPGAWGVFVVAGLVAIVLLRGSRRTA